MKTFSLNEAQSLLPVLEALLRRAIKAKATASELEQQLHQVSQDIFYSGGRLVSPGRIAARRTAAEAAIQQVKDAVEEIDSIGVQVKDLDTGLLDFPCKLGEETVLLCWMLGEPKIAHWHTMEGGFSGRKPLDGRFSERSTGKPN